MRSAFGSGIFAYASRAYAACLKSSFGWISGSRTAYSGTGDWSGEIYGVAWGELDFEAGFEVLELLLDVLSFREVFRDLALTMQS